MPAKESECVPEYFREPLKTGCYSLMKCDESFNKAVGDTAEHQEPLPSLGGKMQIFNNRIPGNMSASSSTNASSSSSSHSNMSTSSLASSSTSNTSPSQASTSSLPPGLNEAGRAARSSHLRSLGGGLANKLHKLFKSNHSHQTQHGAPASAADMMASAGRLLHEANVGAYKKFCEHEAGIHQALDAWSKDSGTLHEVLGPYIKPANKRQGKADTDGLRAGVTALLKGIDNDANASSDLKAAASILNETIIFKAFDEKGKLASFTLGNFAAPDQNGIGKIDDLNLSPEDRKAITQRLNTALAELRSLGKAYADGQQLAPPRLLDDHSYVFASQRNDTRPAPTSSPLGPQTSGADLRRQNAMRRPQGPRPPGPNGKPGTQPRSDTAPLQPGPTGIKGGQPHVAIPEHKVRRPPSIYGDHVAPATVAPRPGKK
ncbi:hypothetical protein [Noviherbaspirillum aerium]|uniref:hypothetical protein n=1 Tax=Noviherbaspirillum aerium TaxID=2588497 RepID=UPI00124CB3D8|nr:hypothetical protein [Noviherbaspirillum aerium]